MTASPQQAYPELTLNYGKAQGYVEELNRQKFAGYENWRLPTIPELMSLLEPEKQSDNLYIDPIFDSEQWWCWSADLLPEGEESSSGSAWYISFYNGNVSRKRLDYNYYVRCVCSRK